ncbi:Chromosome partitioning protein ParA [subsurface metagenome]
MKTIAIVNQKGGTAKTTTAVNLGVALAERKKKVLIIDLDAQHNLSYSFGIKYPELGIAQVLKGSHSVKDVVVEREGVHIVPASVELIDLELALARMDIGRENVLKSRLKGVKGYDYIFIDCSPSLSVLTVNALNACDSVLIPFQVEVLALEGISQLLKTIKQVKRELNRKLSVTGIVPTIYDVRRRVSAEVLQLLRDHAGERIFKTIIRVCTRTVEAPSFGKSVLSYSKRSRGAEDYRALAKEFLKKEGGK